MKYLFLVLLMGCSAYEELSCATAKAVSEGFDFANEQIDIVRKDYGQHIILEYQWAPGELRKIEISPKRNLDFKCANIIIADMKKRSEHGD